jgi:hypothetical protein
LPTSKAVDMLNEDHIEGRAIGVVYKTLNSDAAVHAGAGYSFIGVDLYDSPPVSLGVVATYSDLICDGSRVLEV